MSKIKRKVTVDTVAGSSDDRKKPSVFERLGPGAVRRQVSNYDDSDSDRDEFVQKRCRNWVSTGSCPYGNKCKFLHGPYTTSKHKGGREEDSQEDLRLRVKPKKHKSANKSDSDDSLERSRSRAKKEKIAALKTAIILKKGGLVSDSESPSQWSGDDLDFKKELELEKRRQQLQHELSRLEDEDDVGRENFRIEKKLPRQRLSSSDSCSSDERSRSRKAGKKKKKKRNKHSRSPTKGKSFRSPSPGMDSDDHHKKHKKKKSKKHRDSMSDPDRSPEPEMKPRKLLSPLKFKKSTKAVISKTIMAFHSENDEEAPPPQPPKMHLPMPSRSPIPIIPNLPILQRAKSSSSDDGHRIEKHKGKRSITPSKKKKDRKISPEYVKEPKIEKVKSSKRRSKSRSVSMDRSLSFSPDGKKSKKLEKKKRQKREEAMERVKDSSYERSRTREGQDLTPSSDYRDFSPGHEVVKKKKDKKKEKKKKDRDLSLDREDDRRHKKEKVKVRERERSESPPPTRKQEKRSLDRASRREIDTRTRSPSSSKGSKDVYQERRGRSPEAAQRGDRERDPRDRDGRDQRELRDPRDRDARDPRDTRSDPRDRDPRRDSRQDPRDTRDVREPRDTREAREPRERERDVRDPREREVRERDPRELREPRDPREVREPRDPREVREPRDPRDDPRELRERERPGPGREFEARDVPGRDPRDPSGRDPSGRDPSGRDPSGRDPSGRDPSGRDPSGRDPRDPSGRDPRDPSGRDPRDPSGERRERYPDDRYREEGRRERYEDPRFQQPPPPPPPGGFDDRGRYGRGDREGFPDPGDRGPYGRPEREQRDPGDRREPMDLPFERYGGPNRGDPRYGDGPMRGRGSFDYRDQGPGWERGRGRGRGGWVRGGHDRGGRYDDRSRRGEWDNRRQDEFYGPERREWQDRREDNRRDDRRDGPREEGRDKRDEKTESEKEKDVPAWDKESKREDKKENKEVKNEEKTEETDKKEENSVKEDTKRHEQDLSDVEKKDKKKVEERSRERKDDDQKDSGKDKNKLDTRSKDISGDRRNEETRKDDESNERETSRKRRASNEGSRSPSVKKVRDSSPALSTHSKKSNRDATKEREPETDIPSDKGSVAGSERSKKTDNERSRPHKIHKDEEKKSKKGSDTESAERKRSRSRSRDGSDSGDNKRRRTDAYQEGVGQLAGYVIKDTVGSDREDTNLENIEQNFSDWSDNDSDDDILNRPGETASAQDKGQDRGQSPHGSIGSKHSEKIKIKEEGGDAVKESKKSADVKGPGELESISSDEGSLVEHVKMAAVDALEIDWASMVKDERPKLSTSSALKRFKPGALFAKMGISRQYAGEDLYKEVLAVCQRHQDIETASLEVDSERAKEQVIKTEKSDNEQQDKQTTNNTQTEPNQTQSTAKNNTEPKFEFLHDVAMFHSSAVQKLKERRNLLSNIGPFRRALCARRDLEIRRQLCRVDKVLDQSQMYTSQGMDSDLYKLSIQMLKQAKDPSLKVEAPPPPVPEKCSPVRDSTTLEQTIVEVTCG